MMNAEDVFVAIVLLMVGTVVDFIAVYQYMNKGRNWLYYLLMIIALGMIFFPMSLFESKTLLAITCVYFFAINIIPSMIKPAHGSKLD